MPKELYRDSRKDAVEWGELDLWRESYKENCACARAIEKAIAENFDGMHLNADVAKGVIAEYGFQRVNWVLSNTLNEKKSDGRFSQDNKTWGRRRYVPHDENNWMFCVDSHPAVLDGFINLARKEWDALGMYDARHCIEEIGEQLDYTDRVCIFNAQRMKESHLHPEEQIFLAQSGFGCQPNSRGTKVYGRFLCDDEECYVTRQSLVGVMKDECIPEWAQSKLAELRGDEGMVMA